MIDTKELRKAITRHGARILNEDEVTELLDRLEEAESECFEQARLNGMGSEREAALLSKLEAAEKERDALRARIEAMEQQKPVGWFARVDGDGPLMECKHTDISRVPLYTLPGAQPAPRIPEGWKLVPIEPTPGMRDAWDASPICEDDSAEFRRAYMNMLAAAPEIKP